MNDPQHHASPSDPEPHSDTAARLLQSVARAMALGGGALLIALGLLIVTSVIGRKLFSVPVPGDVELTSIAAAIATAWFFPWCYVAGANVKIDFFTNHWPSRLVAALEASGALLMAVVALVIAWRSAVAMLAVRESNEISAILGLPVWLAYAGLVPAFVLLGLLALHGGFVHGAHASGRTYQVPGEQR